MSQRDPDLERAAAEAAQSRRRSEQDARRAQDTAGVWLRWARRLRELREENGFSQLLDEAMGGPGG